MGWKFQYPRIQNLEMLKPTPRILLGRRLLWTEKKDGSNISIWFKNDKVQISSRNLEQASQDLVTLVKNSEDYPNVLDLLTENPQFVLYVEACRKGRSVTGAELYDRDYLFLFDIYDRSAKQFLNYIAVHQHAYHHNIPVVKLYAETRHRSMKDLLKFKNHVLSVCKEIEIEGMVIKLRKPYVKEIGFVQSKVKLDIPQPQKRKIAKGKIILPPIPENEILGAVDKAWQELGNEKFREVRQAMPLIAKFVSEECRKHLYSSPSRKLFSFYKEYLGRMVENEDE